MTTSEIQSETTDYSQLIYMHSHDVENPLANLCKDPNCPMNRPQSEVQSSIKSVLPIDGKLETYLNSIQRLDGEIHPDMYNHEIATEVDVESSISQQESRHYVPIQKQMAYRLAQQYAESTNVESLRAELESELRAELEAEIRAEMEARVREELRNEYESQVGSNTTAKAVSNPDIDKQQAQFEELQLLTGKFEVAKQNLKLQQMLEMQELQQSHLLAVSDLENQNALPIDMLKLRHLHETEIFKLQERVKLETNRLNADNMKAFQNLQMKRQLKQQVRQLDQQLKQMSLQQNIIVNNAAVSSPTPAQLAAINKELGVTHVVLPEDHKVTAVAELNADQMEGSEASPNSVNEKKKKKQTIIVCTIQ
ncbi:hypothetical protein HDV06_006546 [Boothiomyces sp. JEL0866]|nr:hypothetical protein HDV06_006546 [Boothiomyces sp. JEL0866]